MSSVDVTTILGFKSADGGTRVVLGVADAAGYESALILSPELLDELIAVAISAKDAFPNPPAFGTMQAFVMKAERYDFGHSNDTGDVFVRLRFQKGGHLAVTMDKTLAAQLCEHLQTAVGANQPPSDRQLN